MKNTNFIVLKHPRLDFLNAKDKVSNFITRRLNHAGVKSVQFIDRDDLQNGINKAKNDTDYLVVLDILNPIVDLEFIKHMIERLKATGSKIAISDGAIPGTQVEYVLSPNVSKIPNLEERNIDSVLIRWTSQDKYNNQFNLYKYKRLKMFLFLLKTIENMHTLNIGSFIERISEDDIFEKLAAFGEDVKVHFYKECPHCKGELAPLTMRMSQPFCGYLPISRPLYHECEMCGLVVISPFVDIDSTSMLYDEFDKQDFVVTHTNIYHRGSIRCNFNDFASKLSNAPRTLDLGGGMGGFSKFLKESYPSWDVTHSDFAIKQNSELEDIGIKTRAVNFLTDSIGKNSYDLISAWEVLEHIPYEKLDFALNNIYEALAPGGIFIFSTPDFDSPLCKCNDFFAICPPFHYLVFGQRWLNEYFKVQTQWDMVSMRANSDFLDDSVMWCDYANKTAPSLQLRAVASILKVLIGDDKNKKMLLDNNIGTEVIVTLIKK